MLGEYILPARIPIQIMLQRVDQLHTWREHPYDKPIKTQISNLVRTTRFWNNRVRAKSKDWWIDWFVFNANFSSISAISLREQILY